MRVIIAILAICVTTISILGILDVNTVYVDADSPLSSIENQEFRPTFGAIANLFVAILYAIMVALRYTKLHRFRIYAWALRLFDVIMVISLFVFLWTNIN